MQINTAQKQSKLKLLILPVVFGVIGVILLVAIFAASGRPQFEAEVAQSATVVTDVNASNGSYLRFETQSTSGAPRNNTEAVNIIKASTFRNKTMDNSPYINTPSAQLTSKQDLYASDPGLYNRHSGTYGKVPFFQDTLYPGSASAANGATFRANCEVSHFSYDDPIVFPGQPERAHLHMFFGNTHTNAFSTYDSLLNSGSSTCNGKELNRTAYWMPAMMDGKGNAIIPFNAKFYYKTERNAATGKTKTYPENLQIVADDASNTTALGLATFRCNNIWNGGKSSPSLTIPTCNSTVNGQPGVLEYQIFFDHCWNGNEEEAGDWKANRDSNLVPPARYWHSSECPSSHPILLPALVTHIFFDIPPGTNTSQWHLSSDVDHNTGRVNVPRGSTAHTDWFGAWNKDINKEWIENCNNVPGAFCGEGYLKGAQNNPNGTKALVMREDWDAGQIHSVPLRDIYNQMCSQSDENPYDASNGGASAAYCQPSSHEHQ